MSRFEGELHVLCEEAKWNEVKALVLHTLNGHPTPPTTSSSHADDAPLPKSSKWTEKALRQALVTREGPHQWTPLMISCVRAPLEIIALLCHAEPDACSIADKSGSLPLHFVACWRRASFAEETTAILKILLKCAPSTLACVNAWGQTPLHALLDSKALPPISSLRVFLNDPEEGEDYSKGALATPDGQNRLPLHVAAQKVGMPPEFLHALVEAFPPAAYVTNGQGDLPAHILHKQYPASSPPPTAAMEAVLLPLALGTRRKPPSTPLVKPTSWSQLHALTKQAAEAQQRQPLSVDDFQKELQQADTPAKVACRIGGSLDILPIHLAAHHGVRIEILNGLCRQYPEGVRTSVLWPVPTEQVPKEQVNEKPKNFDQVNGRNPTFLNGAQEVTGVSLEESEDELFEDSSSGDSFGKETLSEKSSSEESFGEDMEQETRGGLTRDNHLALAQISEEEEDEDDDDSSDGVASKERSEDITPDDDEFDDLPVNRPETDLDGDESSLEEALSDASLLAKIVPQNHRVDDDEGSLEGPLFDPPPGVMRLPEKQRHESNNGPIEVPVMDRPLEVPSEQGKSNEIEDEGSLEGPLFDPRPGAFAPGETKRGNEVNEQVAIQQPSANTPAILVTQSEPHVVDDDENELTDELDEWQEESLEGGSEEDDDSCRSRNGFHGPQNVNEIGIHCRTMSAPEIFENGLAGREAAAAANIQRGMNCSPAPLHAAKLDEILRQFDERADLLIAYHIEAVNSISGKRYIDDPERLHRLEQMIRREARNAVVPLSDTVVRVWTYLAHYDGHRSKAFIPNVGHIITCLEPAALWKLTMVPLNDQQFYVRIQATGRTVAEEAELRAPVATMDTMLKYYWFQYMLTTYLPPRDALNYSAACRLTRAVGVRLLPQVPLRVSEAVWEKPRHSDPSTRAPPKPWQRLDVLVTPDCTHSVFVSYYVECQHSDDSQESDHHAFGGMLVVRDDNRKLRPNDTEPWGDAVVAYCNVPPVSGALVRLAFSHVPGRSYGLWHYSRGGPGSSLSVSDVRVRQLLHSCDYRGRSPLHILLSSMVDQSPNPRWNLHVSMLLAAKFGSGDSVGDVPLHYALKCGVSEEVLQAIISASPAALVETDKEGRTPIHAAFLLSKDEPPALGVIRALLTTPGENAIKLKDSSGRLPLHIAAERGAGEAILRLLVDAYQDGCYRTNKDGDLPLHLLLKSGAATTTLVELLVRPIMQNESICRHGGARGVNLPLHISAEYQCSYKVLEKLLQTYGDAALRPRTFSRSDEAVDRPRYALDIFELGVKSKEINASDDSTDSFDSSDVSNPAKEAAKQDVVEADFALRSDLIFVYNPFLMNPLTRKPYRSDRGRIRRLEIMIRREAIQCGEDRKINRRATLTEMAKHAWIFLCTYSNPEDPSDNYAGTVRRVLRGLTAGAVDVLAHIQNPRSEPTPHAFVKDCATPVCSVLIMSRMRFVGRYVLYDELHPVHKSDSCLVMRAKDYGVADEYKRFMSIYQAQEQDVDDDISDASSTVDVAKVTDGAARPNSVTLEMFLSFSRRLGVSETIARDEILRLMKLDDNRTILSSQDDQAGAMIPGNTPDPYLSEEDVSLESKDQQPDDEIVHEVGKGVFTTFCREHRLNDKGIRTVVIKFMKRSSQFQREMDVRSQLQLPGTTWSVVPILDNYNVDRITKARQRDIDILSLRDDVVGEAMSAVPENRDELYALDIQEKNASVHNFALYKYAVVMPAGDRDLAEICQHEELGILQIRDYMLQIGTALKCLHEQGAIHGDVKMANVVRFGKSLALIDFDSACTIPTSSNATRDRMGSGSSKFCTGVLPPEMISRIDLVSDFPKLTHYENYWRKVYEDAKDLNLLTPDDMETITSVIKSLLAKTDTARNLRDVVSQRTLRDEMNDLYSGLENRDDWKDILSMALITISFEDLPFSLNCCEHVDEFAGVWNRLVSHSKMWSKVRPRVSADERYAYVIKTHNDLSDESGKEATESAHLPYTLVSPSEKIDIWAFGVLLFGLCSGGSLFHVGFNGDICESEDFAKLYEWDKQRAAKTVRDKIDDPLAQDLLLQILVPERERLPYMESVLSHPFFGPSSSLEAQRILERHEEQQLILEETVVVKRMTTETRRKVESSMERQCKIIFDEIKIVVPTCLVVLPYVLRRSGKRLIITSEADVALASNVGHYLLEINKAIARLSFWLMMKRNLGSGKSHGTLFKTKLKGWLKRARSEPAEIVANEIVAEIGCSAEYCSLCLELLNSSDSVSNAKSYIKDPMSASRRAIAENNEGLVKCYASQWLYLVDEVNGVPVKSEVDDDDLETNIYPIAMDPNSDLLPKLFLTFMNLAVMKVTASEGLKGLANLLGLPPSYGVPASWKGGEPGLVHLPDKPSSMAEFAVLHEVIRRQDMYDMDTSASGVTDVNVGESGDEMIKLEDFFRDFDPMRTFADLRRVSDGREGSPALWTTEAEVVRIQGELELASVEYKLRELKKEWIKKQKVQQEILRLTDEVRQLKAKSSSPKASSDSKRRVASSDSKRRVGVTPDVTVNKILIPQSVPVQSVPRVQAVEPYLMMDYSNLNGVSSPLAVDPEKPLPGKPNNIRDKNRKKRGIRPYFGAC